MNRVRSKDGTSIAYDRMGSGPPLLLVDGAMCYRDSGPMKPLAERLSADFTVFTYDRRGRGESGDTMPYALEREVEDIAALLAEAGGEALVYGVSSGAALALEAARQGLPIRKLALYEAPFIVDDSRTPVPPSYLRELQDRIARGDRSGAVKSFLRLVGMPGILVAMMPLFPSWRKLKGVAHTLPYDIAMVQPFQQGKLLPVGRWAQVVLPVLVMEGGSSPTWIRRGMHALSAAVPNALLKTLPGQTHMVQAKVLAPVLRDFFAD